jgi:FtsP/CotA-like multicopper oxidase with cupredoxin domain
MRQRLFARRWRRTLATLGVAVLAVGALAAGGAVWLYQDAKQSNVGELAFTNRIALPELAEPTIDEDGRKVFDLRFMAGETELADAGPTDTWGLNGTYLGPTLRAERGDRVRVNVTNDVDEATTLHWHGMHLPARMDGGPHQMIDPGETWSPAWTIDQPAASLWFHPHLHGATADHVYRGAAGMFIVDDPTRDIELPDTYGVDDIPLIIQDKRFDDDGSLAHSAPFASTTGILGDTILLNGTYDPYVEATTTLVRFRVVNASNARVYNLGFTDDRRFWQVGSDSGLLERPHETQRVQVAPGERAEIVVPVEPGDEVVLRSFGPDLGRSMDMGRIDEVVTAGTTEVWEVTNDHGNAHSFHPHLVHFAVLDVDGNHPPPELSGWKDTIYVPPHTTIRIIARFDGEPDPDTPYMYHCHMLAHEDDGMMGQFVIVEPRDEPGEVAGADHEH